METKKLTLWILGILILVVAFLLGYQSGLKGGLNVGYRQAHNDSIISRLFGGVRRVVAPAPTVAQQAAVGAAQTAAAETNIATINNPLTSVPVEKDKVGF